MLDVYNHDYLVTNFFLDPINRGVRIILSLFFCFFRKTNVFSNFYIEENQIFVYPSKFFGLSFFISNIFSSFEDVVIDSIFLSKICCDYRFLDRFQNIMLFNKTKFHSFIIFQKLKTMIKHSFTKINQFIDLTVIDYLGKTKIKNRFFMYYIFFSTFTKTKFFFSFVCPLQTAVYSLTDLFPSTLWAERECFDMFGIKFKENKDLRRILTDYGFRGFPLRKDFPVTGFLQVKFDEVFLNVVYEKLNLMQIEREIFFINPWNNFAKIKEASSFFQTKLNLCFFSLSDLYLKFYT